MTNEITIFHPQPHHTKKRPLPGVFFAAGTAHGSGIGYVEGTITLITTAGQPPAQPINGVQKLFLRKTAANGDKYRWLILFGKPGKAAIAGAPEIPRVPVPEGTYKLEVRGYDAKGGNKVATDCVCMFAVKAVGRGPDFLYPSPGQDISQDAAYFVAYGDETAPVLTAMVGSVPAEFIYNDGTTWSAQFPPLTATGVQVLRVVDSGGESAAETVLL